MLLRSENWNVWEASRRWIFFLESSVGSKVLSLSWKIYLHSYLRTKLRSKHFASMLKCMNMGADAPQKNILSKLVNFSRAANIKWWEILSKIFRSNFFFWVELQFLTCIFMFKRIIIRTSPHLETYKSHILHIYKYT